MDITGEKTTSMVEGYDLTPGVISDPEYPEPAPGEHQEHLAAASTHQLQSNCAPKALHLEFTCLAAVTCGHTTPQQSAHQPRLRSVSKGH